MTEEMLFMLMVAGGFLGSIVGLIGTTITVYRDFPGKRVKLFVAIFAVSMFFLHFGLLFLSMASKGDGVVDVWW